MFFLFLSIIAGVLDLQCEYLNHLVHLQTLSSVPRLKLPEETRSNKKPEEEEEEQFKSFCSTQVISLTNWKLSLLRSVALLSLFRSL